MTTYITIKKEVLKQALEALLRMEKYGDTFLCKSYEQKPYEQVCEAITALSQAIEQAKDVEPVAWCDTDEDGEIAWDKDSCFSDDPAWFDNPMPLYAHPAPAVEKVEPVAWHGVTGDYGFAFLSFQEQPGMTPLYAHPAPAIPEVDCAVCTNRGGLYGLSQETNCEHCLWQGHWHKKDLFAAPEPKP